MNANVENESYRRDFSFWKIIIGMIVGFVVLYVQILTGNFQFGYLPFVGQILLLGIVIYFFYFLCPIISIDIKLRKDRRKGENFLFVNFIIVNAYTILILIAPTLSFGFLTLSIMVFAIYLFSQWFK